MGDMRGRSVRGGATTMGAQLAKAGLKVVETVVLARILTPNDFGLIAMVAAFSGALILFSDAGLSMATVQKKDVSQGQVSNLFWINAALGLVLSLIFVAAAPLVAHVYGDERLILITVAISVTFLLGGLAVQHTALLKRQMRFTVLATADVLATAAAVAVAVLMARKGAGYWALVGLLIGRPLVYGILVWTISGWRPSRPKRNTGVRPMLSFGSQLVGFDVVNYLSRNSDKVMLGVFWGPSVLGLYSRAYELMMLPVVTIRGPLVSVGMAAMSRLQDDENRFRLYYIRLVEAVAFLSMPISALLFVLSEDIVSLILGPVWAAATPIFAALAVTAFIQPSAGMRGLVLLSSGQAGRYLRLGIGISIVTVTFFILGLKWGGKGVAISYAVANYIMLYPTLKYSFNSTRIKVGDYFRAVLEPAFSSVVAGIAAYICLVSVTEHSIVMRIVACSGAFAVIYLLSLYTTSLWTGFLNRMVGYAGELFWRGK